jgi:hypothetical protein
MELVSFSYLVICNILTYSRGSSVSIITDQATGWKTGVQFLPGTEIFLVTTESIPALGPNQPPIQWASGGPFVELKRPGREANNLLKSSANVKNAYQ